MKANPGDVSRYVFTPGAHDRAKKIAAQLKDSALVADSRGYLVFTGVHDGIRMSVCATGMGGPQVAIALEELAQLGADTFIRVGSCGVFKEGLGPGDIIISTGTYRAGGTSLAYLPLNFPAIPTFEVTLALRDAAAELGCTAHLGPGLAGDAFYAPRRSTDQEMLGELIKAGLISVEMESDTLYILGAYRGWRTGALFASDGAPGVVKPEAGEAAFRAGEDRAIQIALWAMAKIARADAGI